MVSLNRGQDYSAVNAEAAVCTIIHSFSPSTAHPACLSAVQLDEALRNYSENLRGGENDDTDLLRNVLEGICKMKVVGKGFVPTLKVRTIFHCLHLLDLT
jgi:hypothetical protein